MKLYNTLSRTIEDVAPLEDNRIRIYSCGPTVYDHAHIGNLSAYIFADTLRRTVKLAGYDVKQVINYTDVDDKTIRRSRERYPDLEPREALRKLTSEYIKLFLQDMQRIGNDTQAPTFARATDHIDSMKELISRLHEGGFAYIADDGVYFSIEAYRKSGRKYGQLLELTAENTSEARIQNDEYDKATVHDFALWKRQKDDETSWEFELDGQSLAGRPGWHIECSAISRDELDQPFDIHTGGVDLIFPHHENEIAQSTALGIPSLAHFFAHNEHILVDGKKMSKSAHNFYTLKDIIQKGYNPLAFRLLVLQAHYRSQAHFSWENLEAAQNRLKRWQGLADLRFQAKSDTKPTPAIEKLFSFPESMMLTVKSALFDDLNTPEAITLMDRLADSLNVAPADDRFLQRLMALLDFWDKAFGLRLLESKDISAEQKKLITQREEARATKDWTKSDELRKKLEGQDIGLRDTEHGAIWYRLGTVQ